MTVCHRRRRQRHVGRRRRPRPRDLCRRHRRHHGQSGGRHGERSRCRHRHSAIGRAVRGSNFADTSMATGFGRQHRMPPASAQRHCRQAFSKAWAATTSSPATAAPRFSYQSATAGVTVDFHIAGWHGDRRRVGRHRHLHAASTRVARLGVQRHASRQRHQHGVETFIGGGGNDIIDGRGGFDRAIYSPPVDNDVTGGVHVNMAAGHGRRAMPRSAPTRCARSSRCAAPTSPTPTTRPASAGRSANVGTNGTFNEFEGMGGNDTITGNGNTRIAFYNATGGVTVDLAAGTATGDGSVGTDTHHRRRATASSARIFADTLFGSNNAPGTRAASRAAPATTPSTAAAASTRRSTATTRGHVRHQRQHGGRHRDRRRGGRHRYAASIESVRGTNFADTYVATGFGAARALIPAANGADFNEFEGLGGNDTITGNGDTRDLLHQARHRR